MYIVVLVLMFVFQLGVMMKGVFESLVLNKTIQKEYDDPLEGIAFASTVLCTSNHCILNATVKYDFKLKVRRRLKRLVRKVVEEKAEKAARRGDNVLMAPTA